MSVPEQAGKVASQTIDALKNSPSCLAAILFACLMAGLTFWNLRDVEAQMHERQMELIQRCYPHADPASGPNGR